VLFALMLTIGTLPLFFLGFYVSSHMLMLARLAPEHPFPTGINDSWDALKWVAQNAASLNANPKAGFIIGGASAGGNITAILALVARDENLEPPLTGQYLCVPALLPPSSVPQKYQAEYVSGKENVNDPVLRTHGDEPIYDLLVPILKMDLKSSLFTPFENVNGFSRLPSAYFQICKSIFLLKD
jgi:acetyl esterase/lipase